MRPAAGRDLGDDFALDGIDDPPRRIVAGDVDPFAVGGAGRLIGPRADLEPLGDLLRGGVVPEQLAGVALEILGGDKDAIGRRSRDEAMRLRPDFDALDDLVGRGVDDVNVVARGAGDIELGGRAGVCRNRTRPK